MPASLFCVDILGKIYELSTSSSQWEPLAYLGVEFKRLSASENSLWAIGGDQQVYVLIYGTENPIRVMEQTYENQVSGDSRLMTWCVDGAFHLCCWQVHKRIVFIGCVVWATSFVQY